MSVLSVENLKKSYGALQAVAGASFSIEAGEVFGLLGPNGAGKSTTINIIATILTADAGRVSVSGVPISTSHDYKRKIGYVPQEISLSERLTARENLAFFGRLYDLSGIALRAAVDEMLAVVGLADRASDLVETFSGGMKRRLNIAASLLHRPDLILLDEPTAGVDPQARAFIFNMVERLAAEGRAILYTTHYMEEAQRLCKRTAIIDHGRIMAMGMLEELVRLVKTKRELVIDAPNLTEVVSEKVAAALGHAHWTITDGALHLSVEDGAPILIQAAKSCGELGISPTSLRIAEPTLETVFLELTGRALRD